MMNMRIIGDTADLTTSISLNDLFACLSPFWIKQLSLRKWFRASFALRRNILHILLTRSILPSIDLGVVNPYPFRVLNIVTSIITYIVITIFIAHMLYYNA